MTDTRCIICLEIVDWKKDYKTTLYSCGLYHPWHVRFKVAPEYSGPVAIYITHQHFKEERLDGLYVVKETIYGEDIWHIIK